VRNVGHGCPKRVGQAQHITQSVGAGRVTTYAGVDEHTGTAVIIPVRFPARIGHRVRSKGERHKLYESPISEESTTYQLMCQVPCYDAHALPNLNAHCLRAGPA
jgi:hypothetical protein